jgi:HD-GYP domain-containing protein (c-di-GMP phosphodiesterase class II)
VEDRELARRVRELGERLANINYGLLHLMKIHSVENSVFDRPIADFQDVLGQLIDLLGPVNLVCVEDQVYVNDIRVRFDVNTEHATVLTGMLQRHNVGGITYYDALDADQVRTLLVLFSQDPAAERPRTSLQTALDRDELSSIELLPTFQFRSDAPDAARDMGDTFKAAAEIIAESFANMAAGRLPNPLPVRRIVNDLIDVTEGRDLARISLEMDNKAPPFARHTLMVTNLSILIGRTAGLPASFLTDLAAAAMFHDVGFCAINGREPTEFSDHVPAGLRMLLRQRGFHEARVRRLLGVLEHHESFNRSGGPPTLQSRIIHIADDYDILTRHRGSRGPICVPPDAIRLMAAQPGGSYDPVLLQIFINVMGAYPPGSVLQLGDGTLVVALSGVRTAETFGTPRCKVVRLADGSKPKEDLWVDLAKTGRIADVLGAKYQPVITEPEPEPESEPETTPELPAKPAPPPPSPTFGDPRLRMPRPAGKNGE